MAKSAALLLTPLRENWSDCNDKRLQRQQQIDRLRFFSKFILNNFDELYPKIALFLLHQVTFFFFFYLSQHVFPFLLKFLHVRTFSIFMRQNSFSFH